MASKIVQRLALAAVLAGALGMGFARVAVATRVPGARPSRPTAARGFNLFAGAPGVTIDANRVQCGLNNTGEQCVNASDSPTLGGGYWPKGSPNQYVFNGGFQIAGIIPGSRADFAWSGDTVGVFFFDASGYVKEGDALTNVYMSTNKDDLDNWPTAAYISDPTLYDPSLLGYKAASQQDTWVRYWDGNLNLTGGRVHAMGVLVDQRTMAWNFPTGNQDIVYFIMRFINITSTLRSRYEGLAAYGYSADDITEVVRLAQVFHNAVQSKYGVTIPDTGYTFTRLYSGPMEDPDVDPVAATANYSTANLPFAMDFAWISAFNVNGWQYPPDIYYGPFAQHIPGFQGLKFLKGPSDSLGNQIGVTMFTNTDRIRGLGDRQTTQSLWRLGSNNMLPVDGQCNVPANTPLCFVGDVPSDTRMYMFSGPSVINPGESQVVVTASVFAAAWNPGFVAGNGDGLGHTLGQTTFDIRPSFPGTVTGYVSATSRLGQTGYDTLRTVDRLTGWNSVGPNVNTLDANGNGRLEQTEIPVIKGSLLGKALVAQAVFDAKFLLPYAPDAPPFYLIPGDNQVTVVWQPSLTETVGHGDPYFAVASNPLNALYDQDYRANDVEGYRIYRGRTQSELQLVAQFDYAGTFIIDYTGQFNNSDYGAQCAPELGVTATCPAFPHRVALVGDVIQVRTGDRTLLSSGDVLITVADTAVTGGNTGYPALRDTGVPFAYVDHAVRDGFRYYYAVTAFDINSVKSGPSSLESARATKTTTPRVASGQEATGVLSAPTLLGSDGNTLDLTAAEPTIDATTGIFSGPAPATNGLNLSLAAFLPQVLQDGSVTLTVDSVIPGNWGDIDYAAGVIPSTYWFTGQGAGAPVKFSTTLVAPGTTGADGTGSSNFLATAMDSAAASRFGGDQTFSLFGTATVSSPGVYQLTQKGRASVNTGADAWQQGPRWWTGAANENTNDPNGINCGTVTGSYSCVLGNLSRNAGAIAGVGIFHIQSYMTVASSAPARDIEIITSSVMRAADFKWYWGAAGAVDSVVDVTHHVRVPFSPKVRASWGILNDSSFVRVVNKQLLPDTSITRLTWSDYACVAPFVKRFNLCGGVANFTAPDSGAVFQNHARLTPVNFASSAYSTGTTGSRALTAAAASGNGFLVYLNGEFFLMQMASLPAAGTVWSARFYSGDITGGVGSYGFVPATRPANVPGLRMRISYTGSTLNPAVTADSMLARVHTVPDPYYVTDQLELTSSTKVLRFVNLPSQAIIRIYSVSGILVNLLTHNDPAGGGEEVWNLRNRNNQFVASGVYFYHVETPDGRKKIGRFTVVNYAQ